MDMFEKFTERARKVMSLSRQEAQRFNSEFIGTEHMLLAIVVEGGGVAAKVLKNLKLELKRIRQEVEKLITPSSSPTVTLGQLPFSPRAKRVIELAGESASQLGQQDVVGTEHLLLGLLKENEGIAAQVLINLGLKLDEVRDSILYVLGVDVTVANVSDPDPLLPKGYVITLDKDLDPRSVGQIVDAVRLLKGVESVEKIRGLWLTHEVFEMIAKGFKKDKPASPPVHPDDAPDDKETTNGGDESPNST